MSKVAQRIRSNELIIIIRSRLSPTQEKDLKGLSLIWLPQENQVAKDRAMLS